jgi:hypothetical protein
LGKIGGDKQLRPLTVFVQYTFITVRFSAEYQTMYQLNAIDENNLISVAEHDWFVSQLYLQSQSDMTIGQRIWSMSVAWKYKKKLKCIQSQPTFSKLTKD